MKIDGIPGDSNVSGHENWIQCMELSWEAVRPIPTDTGNIQDRTEVLLQTKEVSIKKHMDTNSAKLFQFSGSNEGKKIEIHFLSETDNEVESYSEWTLENSLISHSSISVGANGQDDAIETLHLNFVSIEIKFLTRWGRWGSNFNLSCYI